MFLASFSALIFYGDDRIVRVASGPYIVGLTRFCQDKMSLVQGSLVVCCVSGTRLVPLSCACQCTASVAPFGLTNPGIYAIFPASFLACARSFSDPKNQIASYAGGCLVGAGAKNTFAAWQQRSLRLRQ